MQRSIPFIRVSDATAAFDLYERRGALLMKIRIISSIVALMILVPIVIFSGTVVLPVAVAIVSVLAVFEMLRCCNVHKRLLFALPYYFAAVLVPTYLYLSVKLESGVPISAALLLLMFFFVIWTYPVAIFSKGKMPVTDAATASIGCIYIIAGLNAILYTRQIMPEGIYLFALVFIGAWITDSAAYFCGRAFGKHKLIPDVSPKKTVEGSIGGILFCVLFFAIYALIVEKWIAGGSVAANYPALLISAFFISIVSQIGDLAMSLLKRHYNIKDFGKIMPGHGGVLDRFDSVLAVSVVLLICSLISSGLFGADLFAPVV